MRVSRVSTVSKRIEEEVEEEVVVVEVNVEKGGKKYKIIHPR